ncbi:MAG: hypothetical protein IAE91_00060 [Ignavibacteriaceae bacterium]|nr:hypothetical protein [Ignavibacteriaceae bacterium]
MSKELLYRLNGNNNGRLKKYLDSFNEPINIAWYPSAGVDFRSLLYLSPEYAKINPATIEEKVFPNFFIFSDYYPWSYSTFLDYRLIYNDARTFVSVTNIEELPRLDLPTDHEIVDFPEGSSATGRVLFIEVFVSSEKLGDFNYPLIYAFVENEPFCSKILLSNNYDISHIMHIRYGGGLMGGGKSSGLWVLNVLKRLNCKLFITDSHYALQHGDKAAYRIYKNLKGKKPEMSVIRTLNSESWSGHGDVTWNIIK